MKRVAAFLLLLMLTQAAAAHISSSGFLVLEIEGHRVNGSMELAVRDAELTVGLDANHDGKITWGELRNSEGRLFRYVTQHLVLSAQGPDYFVIHWRDDDQSSRLRVLGRIGEAAASCG